MKKKILIVGCVVVLAGLLCVVLLIQPAPQKAQSFKLPNGSEVTLVDVTYGTNGIIWGTPFQKKLYRLLPGQLKKYASVSFISSGISTMGTGAVVTNKPIFWIYDTQVQLGSDAFGVRVLDEYGWDYDPNGYSMGSQYMPNGGSLQHYSLETMAPRGEMAGLAFYDSQTKTNRLGEFLLSGAKVQSPPVVTNILQSRQEGDITFQLVSLQTGFTSVAPTYGSPPRGGSGFSRAVFRVMRNGRPETSWTLGRFDINGPAGGPGSPGRATAYRGDEIACNFYGKLDPPAGPWKLQVEFWQQRDFSAESLAEFKDVPFPAAGEVSEPGLTTNVMGETVRILKMYGAGSERPASTPAWFGTRPFVELQMTPGASSNRFRWLSAKDAIGNDLSYSSSSGTMGRYFGAFQQTAAPKSVTMKFAVHHSWVVEFEAKAEAGVVSH